MRPVLMLLALALGGLTACSRSTPAGPATDSTPPLPVRTAVLALESQSILVEAPATVRPVQRAAIAARLAGTIATLPLGLGQKVAAGEVLLTLNAPDAEARVRQAQAQLAEARRTAQRAQTLVTQGASAPDTLQDATDRLHYAEAALTEAEAQFAYATVRAPFAGVVTEKFALPGDLATPGLPLLTLESTEDLRAEGPVPESAATALQIGAPLTVLLGDGQAPVVGRIEEFSVAADAVSRSVLVKVSLPAGRARSGQFARLQISAGHTSTLLVPAAAVSLHGQIERVFVVDQNRAGLRLVKTGRPVADRVEILSGLHPGEVIILAPPAALRDGQPVVTSP
jgi:membrane fusion protein, multidrug efflux system